MAKYIHHFGTEAEFNQEWNSNYTEPWVSYTEGKGLDYNKPDYSKMPFTIEALGSGNLTWNLGAKTVQYSKNGGSWETMDSGTTISVVEGDEVAFKGTNTTYDNNKISSTAQFNVKGNIMSLTNGDNFEMADSFPDTNCFCSLFDGCSYIISAGNLKLPVLTLEEACYAGMFYGCTNLTTAPDLPATTMEPYCYENMFNGCTSLTTAPELPAMTLAEACYESMFRGCISLTTAPELPATTLAEDCYESMFFDCVALTRAPELLATTLEYICYHYMFNGCTSLNYIKAMFLTDPEQLFATNNWVNGVSSTGTFVKNASATWTTTGNSGVPTGWTVQTATQ